MKRKTLFLAFLTIITIVALLSSCFHFKAEINEVNPAFGQYISAYTSGMVSRKTSIRIELAKGYFETHPVLNKSSVKDSVLFASPANAQLVALPDSTILEDIFTFEPKIKGKAIWISDRIIEFIPAETLPVNQLYNVKFNLEDVMVVPEDFETFRFQFSTFPQNLFVTVDGLRTYDDYNIEWQKLTGKLTTSDNEDTSAIRKTLTVTQNGKKICLS